MKLIRFDEGRIGIVAEGDRVIDVSDVVGPDLPGSPPVAMNRLIDMYAQYEPILKKRALSALTSLSLDAVRLLAPVPAASKVIAYPVNYDDHAREMGQSVRAPAQGFFLKPPSSLSGAGEPIVLPAIDASRRVDHECELAIVIGKRGRDIPREKWQEHVFGYSCLIDVVVRGKEERVARKAFDTFCPMGPWIVTADEVGDPSRLRGRLWVNDELRQDANNRDLVLDIPGMVEMASQVMTLEPGDIIAGGTPAGVGPIKPGDRVRIEFERVGSMVIGVVQGDSGRGPLFRQPA